MCPDTQEREERLTGFVTELTKAQFALQAFVCMLLGNRDAAQDVLQDTNVALLRHAGEYDARRPFLPWAKAFAFNQARAYLKRETRSRMVFDDELVTAMAETRADEPDESGRVLELLDVCLERLSAIQKDLIQRRYFRRESVAEMARRLKRSSISVYVQIHRIRRLLGGCIEDRLRGEHSGAVP